MGVLLAWAEYFLFVDVRSFCPRTNYCGRVSTPCLESGRLVALDLESETLATYD